MSKEKVIRNKEIMRLRVEGWELKEIGKEVGGISKQRIFQVLEQARKDRKELRRLKKKNL